jgi:hypothetical protein
MTSRRLSPGVAVHPLRCTRNQSPGDPSRLPGVRGAGRRVGELGLRRASHAVELGPPLTLTSGRPLRARPGTSGLLPLPGRRRSTDRQDELAVPCPARLITSSTSYGRRAPRATTSIPPEVPGTTVRRSQVQVASSPSVWPMAPKMSPLEAIVAIGIARSIGAHREHSSRGLTGGDWFASRGSIGTRLRIHQRLPTSTPCSVQAARASRVSRGWNSGSGRGTACRGAGA